MFKSTALWVRRSTIAVTRTLSAIISLHLLKARFVVMMTVFLSGSERQMVEEQFAGFFVTGDVSELVAYHKVVVDEPVFKRTECAFLPCLFDLRYKPWHGGEHYGHALSAGLDTQSSGNVRFACSGLPYRTRFRPCRTKSSDRSSGRAVRASSGSSSTMRSPRYLSCGKSARFIRVRRRLSARIFKLVLHHDGHEVLHAP